jgi:aquaporin Z
MEENWRSYAAELLGTFILVFGGTTAVVASGRAGVPVLLPAAFAFGLALLAGLYAFGEVSGGHFNPAVSLAMFLDRRLAARELVAYWAAQFLGAILAAIVLLIATSKHDVASAANKPSSDGTAFVIELVLTAIFVLVILQASRSERFGASALIAIPLTLTLAHLVAIPFTGCSVNPARTFGPDLVGNTWSGVWIFLIAPPLGAALAWAVHAYVVTGTVGRAAPAVAEVLDDGAA